MTDLVARIEALLTAATPGPWELWADDDDVIGVVVCQMWPTAMKVMKSHAVKPFADDPDPFDNAALIAATPGLLAEAVEALQQAKEFRVQATAHAIDLYAELARTEARLAEAEQALQAGGES